MPLERCLASAKVNYAHENIGGMVVTDKPGGTRELHSRLAKHVVVVIVKSCLLTRGLG